MGLITTEVEVKITSNMVKYYENLGYIIPKRNHSESRKYRKGLIYDIGSFITVKVKDLSKGSKVLVDCECDYCGKIITIPYKKYYEVMHSDNAKICCTECRSKKVEENQLRLYGVKHPMQRDEVKESLSQSFLNKYGVKYPTQSEQIRDKIKHNLQEKYGVDNPSQLNWVKEKKIRTSRNHYGVDYACQAKEVKNKIKETNLKRYGVECSLQNPDVLKKQKETCLRKYGVEYAMQNKEILKKAQQTYYERYKDDDPRYSEKANIKRKNTFYNNQTISTSRQQRYLASLYKMKLNYPLVYWNVDMFDEKTNIYLEFDGSGHFLNVKYHNITEEEFKEKEIKRYYSLKHNGYKMIRVISQTDKLPSDNILLRMLFDAQLYFQEYPNHSWIYFDIDNEIVRNAEHKDGVPYFYGELRKIKESDLKSA